MELFGFLMLVCLLAFVAIVASLGPKHPRASAPGPVDVRGAVSTAVTSFDRDGGVPTHVVRALDTAAPERVIAAIADEADRCVRGRALPRLAVEVLEPETDAHAMWTALLHRDIEAAQAAVGPGRSPLVPLLTLAVLARREAIGSREEAA